VSVARFDPADAAFAAGPGGQAETLNHMPRALIIAYDFPPHGAIGTMRTLRLVRELSQDGWRVSVITGSPATYLSGTPIEPSLEAKVPVEVEVLRVRAIRPFAALENLLRRLRRRRDRAGGERAASPAPGTAPPQSRTGLRHAFSRAIGSVEAALDIPDKESGWILPAILRGVWHMLRAGRPDVIYSSAPPWSGQVVALWLTRFSGRPWVADFRDPWARAPGRDWRRPFRFRAVERLERQVVGRADAVLFVTRANLDEFTAFYGPRAARRFHLVPNGCDPTEFESITAEPPAGTFVLLHAGTFYGPRNPLPILRGVASAVRRGVLDPARARVRLLGTSSLTVDLAAEARRLGIEQIVEILPRASREETLTQMKGASALLLVQTNTTVSIPGKAYEYLAAGRPVLALSEEGETAELVRASGLGIVVRPDEPIEVLEAAVLDIVALAARPVAPAAPELFDGRVHAATTERLLLAFARKDRRRLSEAQSLAGSRQSAITEESRR
jgi:glycosyltransferase involved in cell wall biosynthesis